MPLAETAPTAASYAMAAQQRAPAKQPKRHCRRQQSSALATARSFKRLKRAGKAAYHQPAASNASSSTLLHALPTTASLRRHQQSYSCLRAGRGSGVDEANNLSKFISHQSKSISSARYSVLNMAGSRRY